MDVNKGISLDDVLPVAIIFVFNCKLGIWSTSKHAPRLPWTEVGLGSFYSVRNYLNYNLLKFFCNVDLIRNELELYCVKEIASFIKVYYSI